VSFYIQPSLSTYISVTPLIREQARIDHLLRTHGVIGAKKEAIKICHLYFKFLHGLHRGKNKDGSDNGPIMTMFYNPLRESLQELLNFIEAETNEQT